MNCMYLSVTLEKRKLTLDDYLDAYKRYPYSHVQEVTKELEQAPREKEVVVRLNTMDMAILIFTVVSVLFMIAILIYKAFFAEPSRQKEVINNADTESYTNTVSTKETSAEDFDYPYEDIGDALKGDSYVG